MVQEYAIKINNKYFKEFKYADKNTLGRYSGHCEAGIYQEGDIIDIELTDKIECAITRRNLGEKIKLIYDIDKFKNKKIIIIPIVQDN